MRLFMKKIKLPIFSVLFALLSGCNLSYNPNGPKATDYPYFEVPEPLIIKHITVPTGTKLIYEESFFRSGKQSKRLNDKKLTGIILPTDNTIKWGGVPITAIRKYANPGMTGFTVYADFKLLGEEEKTKFSEAWQFCDTTISVNVQDINDWSFNKKNILDIESAGIAYMRFHKDDKDQNKALDDIYNALLEVNIK